MVWTDPKSTTGDQITGRPLAMYVRRRPTLPQPLGCSTIGAGRLNFRVRDGSGCFPVAVAAVTLLTPFVSPAARCVGWVVGVGFVDACLWWCRFVWCLGCFVTVPRQHGLLVVLGVCVASVRPISTGRLGIAAVHLRPINPIVCWGPYTLKGVGKPHLETCFPLRCVQRLSLPNVANQPCTWRYNWHTRGSSIPVLSY